MVKHILGQAFFQATILLIFTFAGHQFIPEAIEGPRNNDKTIGITNEMIMNHPNPIYRAWDGNWVQYGMIKDFRGDPVYSEYSYLTNSRHFTMVFNVFVCMQIFNMLTARKLYDEFNIFEGVFTNWMFIGVWFVITGGQIIIV